MKIATISWSLFLNLTYSQDKRLHLSYILWAEHTEQDHHRYFWALISKTADRMASTRVIISYIADWVLVV
jgi:hypothetical protein